LFLTGCGTFGTVESSLKKVDAKGEVLEKYIFKGRADELVKLELESGEKVEFDRKGGPGFFEDLLKLMLLKTDVVISNKGRE
jgi:hypothetical protein